MSKVKGKTPPVPRRKRFPFRRLIIVLLVVFFAWLIYLDATIRERFEGQRWQLPAQVFAQPMEVYPGRVLNPQELVAVLKQLGYQPVASPSRPGQFSHQGSRVDVHARSFLFPEGYRAAGRYRLQFADGRVQQIQGSSGNSDWLTLDPMHIGGIYPSSNEDRVLVSLSQVPPELIAMLIAVEDRHFREHSGISVTGILRAAWVNFQAGKVVQGGSTLTQQLVKNLFLHEGKTLLRKLNEAVMALLLEWHYSKDEILEAYLNEVYLGQSGRRGVHGFGQASLFYFGKSIEDLAPEESALLVGLVKGASWYDPRRHPQRARDRRNLVLRLVAESGDVNPSTLRELEKRPIDVMSTGQLSSNRFPGFLELVKQQLKSSYPLEVLQSQGLRVFTSLEPQVQAKAEMALSRTLRQINRGPKDTDLEGGLVVTAHQTGEVVALVPGSDPRYAGFNRVLEARRPIGSLMKPVVLAGALAKGQDNLLSSLSDRRFRLTFEDGQVWEPENYDREEHGDVTVLQAITHSYNLAFTRLGLKVGVKEVLALLESLGANDLPPPYPSTLLGAVELTPLEVTQVYQNLVGGGFSLPLRSVRVVTDAGGGIVEGYPYQPRQVIDARAAYQWQYALQMVMRQGTGKSAYARLPDTINLGGKTGTTNDGRDSWFVGFSGDWLTTVWLGRDDNEKTHLTGATGALRVWTELYRNLPLSSWDPPAPADIAWLRVDPDTSLPYEPGCDEGLPLPVEQGFIPENTSPCPAMLPGLKGLRNWWQSVFQ